MPFILMTALALSVDGFAAGIAFGLRGVRIGPSSMGIIALLSAVFAAVSVAAGGMLAYFLPQEAGKLIGAAILIVLGGLAMIRPFRPDPPPHSPKPPAQRKFHALGLTILVIREPSEGDLDHSGNIDPREAFLLGVSLSIDMLGAGIGFALTGANGLWLPPIVGLVQSACLFLGGFVGRQANRLPFGKKAFGVCSGLLLLGLGTARLIV